MLSFDETVASADVHSFLSQVNWLKESPAWKKAMEFLQEHWVKTAKGDWVSKRDLEDDMSTSFDDLLASMKEEDT